MHITQHHEASQGFNLWSRYNESESKSNGGATLPKIILWLLGSSKLDFKISAKRFTEFHWTVCHHIWIFELRFFSLTKHQHDLGSVLILT